MTKSELQALVNDCVDIANEAVIRGGRQKEGQWEAVGNISAVLLAEALQTVYMAEGQLYNNKDG